VIDELAPLMGGGRHPHRLRQRALRGHPAAREAAAARSVGCTSWAPGCPAARRARCWARAIMPGGSAEVLRVARADVRAGSRRRVDGTPCCTHIGPDGAGHFVKMVHNGIEYADMQLIAEAYDLLREGLAAEPAELAAIFTQWNRRRPGVVPDRGRRAEVLGHVDGVTGRPFVDVVLDQAEQKGTGRWTVQIALDLGIPVTGIAEATFARALSAHPEQRAAAQGDAARTDVRRGPCRPLSRSDRDGFVEDVRKALYASKMVAYAQGYDQMARGQRPSTTGTSTWVRWRPSGAAGCIIRARFPGPDPGGLRRRTRTLPSLLVDPYFRGRGGAGARTRGAGSSRTPAQVGIPTPGVLVVAGLLRRVAGRATARVADPGAAGTSSARHTYRRVDRDGRVPHDCGPRTAGRSVLDPPGMLEHRPGLQRCMVKTAPDRRPQGVGFRSERGPVLAALMLCTGLVALDKHDHRDGPCRRWCVDLGGFAQFPWLFSIYLLTQAVTVPLYGEAGRTWWAASR